MALPFQTIQSLDHHGPEGMMGGLLEIMFQRKMTVGDLVKILEKIERPDVLEILFEAGLQDHTAHDNETGMMQKFECFVYRAG